MPGWRDPDQPDREVDLSRDFAIPMGPQVGKRRPVLESPYTEPNPIPPEYRGGTRRLDPWWGNSLLRELDATPPLEEAVERAVQAITTVIGPGYGHLRRKAASRVAERFGFQVSEPHVDLDQVFNELQIEPHDQGDTE